MVQRHQISLRERQWSQRQKGQCALSHFCSYSLALKEPKRKTLWKYLLPKAYYSITLAHCLVYNSRGENHSHWRAVRCR